MLQTRILLGGRRHTGGSAPKQLSYRYKSPICPGRFHDIPMCAEDSVQQSEQASQLTSLISADQPAVFVAEPSQERINYVKRGFL